MFDFDRPITLGQATTALFILGLLQTAIAAHYLSTEQQTVVSLENEISSLELNLNLLSQNNLMHRSGVSGGAQDTQSSSGNASLIVTKPNGGEAYCIGKNVDLEWSAPKDMTDPVTVSVVTTGAGKNGGQIGTYKTISEAGQAGLGQATWTIGGGSYTVAPGYYKIMVNGTYNGKGVSDSSDDWFRVDNCQG